MPAPLLDPSARRTMIAAVVPQAEPLVGVFRDELDPTARRGLGAHLTLVYPFVLPAEVTATTVATLRAAVAPVPAFSCTFGKLRWFGERVLWLAPDTEHAVDAFREIAERVRAAFPDLEREDRELVPHLTVGLRRAASTAALRRAEEALAPRLPLTVRVAAVQLLVRSETWDVGAEAPLGAAGHLSPSGPPGPGSPASP